MTNILINDIIIIEKGKGMIIMAKKMTPAKRHAIRAKYEEMQKERKRVENFLNSKTSTKTGTRKSINKMLKTTGLDKHFKTKDIMKNKKTLDKYFKVYKKVREYDRVKGVGRSYRSTMNAVTSVFESVGGKGSADDILDNVIRSLDIEENTIFNSDYDLKWIL